MHKDSVKIVYCHWTSVSVATFTVLAFWLHACILSSLPHLQTPGYHFPKILSLFSCFCECLQMMQDETLLRRYLKLGMWKTYKKTTQASAVDIPALLLCEGGHHFTEFLWESIFSCLKISLAKDLISFDECAPLKFSKWKIEFLVLF